VSGESWIGFPRAEATVECGGASHRVRWERGRLLTLDHEDPEAERALAALGGEPCACVALLDAWARYATDVRMLVLGTRGGSDVIPPPDRADPFAGVMHVAGRAGVMHVAGRPTGPAPLPGQAEGEAEARELERIASLLSLGGGLPRRLLATVAANWRERLLAPDGAEDEELSGVRARLEAALYGRALASLATWLEVNELELDFEPLPEDERPALSADPTGRLRARLPFGWMVDVWGRGLETIWGRFCLSAATSDGVHWELLTVGPDLADPAVIRVELPALPEPPGRP